ncbi:MAG: FadR/GntR family transcriptional regulator [Ancrocorticia sp.]|uniref:FadR/GntR family transcriptional regulator n=1 Tax=Ancrocorticia sp. TaxID=2593684 RepID=UPI003F9125D3
MSRESLVDAVISQMLSDIAEGNLEEGAAIPSEADLAQRFDVNRLTIREAVSKMKAQGIVRAVPGRRSELNPVSHWVDIGAVLKIVEQRIGGAEASVQLVQLRRMIETGACGIAATQISTSELAQLDIELDGMKDAQKVNDVEKFVRHDIAFHDVILDACGNAFLRMLLDPLQELLKDRRRETSAVPQVQINAIDMHRQIIVALRSEDPETARSAMSDHIDQTERDLNQYVL